MAIAFKPSWATHLSLYKEENSNEKKQLLTELGEISRELKDNLEQFKQGGTPQDITRALKGIHNKMATLYKTIQERFYPQTTLLQFGEEEKVKRTSQREKGE